MGRNGSNPLQDDRFFDPNPAVRSVAREIYEGIKFLPIISPHGHVNPALFVTDAPFQNPTELLLLPDHYVLRMLYSQGIPMETLGIAPVDGGAYERDPRAIWQTFSDHYYLFRGTPSGVWLDYEFAVIFGVREKLNSENAGEIYETIAAKLRLPEFRPRALFERFGIEVLSTTDAATDPLDQHRQIRASGWKGNVIPCFRPDGLTDITARNWLVNIQKLGRLVGKEIVGFGSYIAALEVRRAAFKALGAVSTDHGVSSPYTHRLSATEAEVVFQRALRGESTRQDAALFTAHMLMEMARMSVEDGLVMQIHPGAFRDHNEAIASRFGPDRGCDIPVQTEFTHNLRELLNTFGNEPRFGLIVFTLDETAYARELAPLAGHYPAMKLGPPWWFNDSIEGMRRFRSMTTETAGIYNTAGFNDDTRAFVSIPARHDLARRMDAEYLAGLVTRHIIEPDEARSMAYALANGLVRKAYRFSRAAD
jgi:glucuronate isomerase